MSKNSGLLRPAVNQSDQTEFKNAKDRLIKAYCRRAQCENRILKHRREVEAIVKRINGHLSKDDRLDYEKFLPIAMSSPTRHTFSRESIMQISTLQASLDSVKARINALLDVNMQLRERLNRHSDCCGDQISKLNAIINELVALRDKERELAGDNIPDIHDELTETVEKDRDYEGTIDNRPSHTPEHDIDMTNNGPRLPPRESSPVPTCTPVLHSPRTPLFEPPHSEENRAASTEQIFPESLEPRTPLNMMDDAPEATSQAPDGSISSFQRE